MAIEFNCPYCTSSIRVADAAAGKRGRCPRCQEQLLVPDPRPDSLRSGATQAAPTQPVAATAPVSDLPPAATAVPPELDTPAAPQLDPVTSATPDLPVPVLAPPAPAPAPVYAKPRRRRRRASNGLVFGILGVCLVAIVGLAGYQYWTEQPIVLEGQFEGEFVGASLLSPMIIPTGDVTASPDTKSAVIRSLRQIPYSLKSQLVVTEFRGSDQGLEVRLIPTTNTAIVRVTPRDDATLADWLDENTTRITNKRNDDLKQAIEKFFLDYGTYTAGGPTISDPGYYRNQLGLSAFSGGLGYVVEAIAGRQVCPCVFEDESGNLYFAVPDQTTAFVLRGRKLTNGRKWFPGTYNVSCAAIPETVEVVDPAEAAANPPKTDPGGEKSTQPDMTDDD